MDKLPRYKGIELQYTYTHRLIDSFIKRHGLNYLCLEKEVQEIVRKSITHSKRLTKAYNQTRRYNKSGF